jgi:glyoxylase I family protein
MADQVPTERMHHVSFAVPALAPALAFYKDCLGFSDIPRPPLDFEGAWLAKDGLEIHIIVPKEGFERAKPASKPNPYLSHLAFKTADIEAARAALEAHGLQVIENKGRVPQLWVLDPGGNMIEFIQV